MADFLDKFKDAPDEQPKIQISQKIPGRIIRRNGTKFLETVTSTSPELTLPLSNVFRQEYVNCLELIYGIRERKSQKF